MPGALEGIRILDLTRVLAGPYATMVLADLGAEVIKIEIPGKGDNAHEFGPFLNGESAYFMSLNRNKRSMTMNLKLPEAKALFLKMVEKVDVVVENFRPGTMDRLGLGYEVLKTCNPRLVYAAASGFGYSGPYSQRPAYDAVVQAMGGIMSITSAQADGPPTRVGTSIGDITAGLFTAIGILAAIYRCRRSGKGQFVDVAMLDCQLAILENAIARYLISGEVPRPIGNRHPSITPFEPFDTKDGQIMLAVGNDTIWKIFCRVAELEHLLDDPRFVTISKRNENYLDIRPPIADRMETKTTEEWRQIFDDAGVPNGPINTVDQVINDPQVISRRMVEEVDHPAAGRVKIPGIPIKMSETPGHIERPAPMLGEHTEEILTEVFECSQAEVEALKQKGIFE